MGKHNLSAADQEMLEEVNATGWPRPRVQATVGDETGSWPMPWVSDMTISDGIPVGLLSANDLARYRLIEKHWLCQVCGQTCQDTAYAPLSPDCDMEDGSVFIYSGPVCSLRCTKLALALCPHFEGVSTIVSFQRSDARFSQYQELLNIYSFEVVAS